MGNGFTETPTVAVRRDGQVFHCREDQVLDTDDVLSGDIASITETQQAKMGSPDATKAEAELRAELVEKTIRDLSAEAERLTLTVPPGTRKGALIDLLIPALLAEDAKVEADALAAAAKDGEKPSGADGSGGAAE